jgi:hypothetical protein
MMDGIDDGEKMISLLKAFRLQRGAPGWGVKSVSRDCQASTVVVDLSYWSAHPSARCLPFPGDTQLIDSLFNHAYCVLSLAHSDLLPCSQGHVHCTSLRVSSKTSNTLKPKLI